MKTNLVYDPANSITEDYYNRGFKEGYDKGISDGKKQMDVELRKVIGRYKNSYPRPAGIIEAMESILES